MFVLNSWSCLLQKTEKKTTLESDLNFFYHILFLYTLTCYHADLAPMRQLRGLVFASTGKRQLHANSLVMRFKIQNLTKIHLKLTDIKAVKKNYELELSP